MNVLNSVNDNSFNELLAYINNREKTSKPFSHNIKIHFLRNYTIEPLIPFLKYHLYKCDINPIISVSNYDSIQQDILDPDSILAKIKPDLIVLSMHYHVNDLSSHFTPAELETEIISLFTLLKEKTDACVVVNTQIPVFYSTLMINNVDIYGLPAHFGSLNNVIRDFVMQNSSKFILLDWEKYAQLLGEDNSMDYRYWYLNKAPFKKFFLNVYANDIARIMRVLKGQQKKCLVLDCDGTLWGGIVGEDGIEGIKLDNYDYPGKIYYDFQQTVISLYKQGVIITLCSKNNPDDVWQVIDSHPACLLKREHISAFRINWEDKMTNIISLAQELNLGIDSFVFVDDSHVECDLIRKMLSQVTVLQVPKYLSIYPQMLRKDNVFDVLALNEDDKNRTLRYQQEGFRREYENQFSTIDEYLSSLALKIKILPVTEKEISRIAQLTQKTNQFNLSVRRYTESEIKAFVDSTDSDVYSLQVSDRFGDYGLTGMLIACCKENMIKLDSFLLSCRVLSRRVEYAFLAHCLKYLTDTWSRTRIHAYFLPTDRNMQIQDFLLSTGFYKIGESNNDHIYELDCLPALPRIDFIHVETENTR